MLTAVSKNSALGIAAAGVNGLHCAVFSVNRPELVLNQW